MLRLDPSRMEYPSKHRYDAVVAQPVCFQGTFGNVLWRDFLSGEDLETQRG